MPAGLGKGIFLKKRSSQVFYPFKAYPLYTIPLPRSGKGARINVVLLNLVIDDLVLRAAHLPQSLQTSGDSRAALPFNDAVARFEQELLIDALKPGTTYRRHLKGKSAAGLRNFSL